MSTRYSGYTAMVADGRASATREQEVRRQKPSQSTRPGPARSTVERNWVPSRPCCKALRRVRFGTNGPNNGS